jgi:uncharacterized protein YueI
MHWYLGERETDIHFVSLQTLQTDFTLQLAIEHAVNDDCADSQGKRNACDDGVGPEQPGRNS